jgi:rRNA-processing protein FCF1
MTTKLERISIYFPKSVLDDLRRLVPERRRSALIVAATEKEVDRLKTLATLDRTAGAWKDEDYPELATDEDIENYVHDLRASWHTREVTNNDA